MKLLNEGDRIWVKIPGTGFVGVGRVTGVARPAIDFTLKNPEGEHPGLEVLKAFYCRDAVNNRDDCEYFVPVRWLHTVPTTHAFFEIGLFGNQNTVCKPTTPKWRRTVERLKQHFTGWDKQ